MKTKTSVAASSRYAGVSRESGSRPSVNVRFTGVGADWKRVAILAALLMVAGYFFTSRRLSPRSPSHESPATSTGAKTLSSVTAREVSRVSRSGQRKARAEDLKPSLKPKKNEEFDGSKIDPTLHSELLAKL